VGSVLVSYETGAKTAPAAAAKRVVAENQTKTEEDAGTVVGSVAGTMTVPQQFARRVETDQDGRPPSKAMATPAVRRVAKELGIDIDQVHGTGRGGRVTASDVQAHAGGGARAAVAEAPPPAPLAAVPISADGVAQRIPIRGVRRTIAESLDRSVKTAVHFTVVDEADVTNLDRKRREYSAVTGRKLSFLPLVLTAVCRALRKHPAVNANVDDDKQEILIKDVINLGIAVDTDHGLMVPVIGGADGLSIVQLAEAVEELASQCRTRTIARERLIGGTFTISNVGSAGGMFATPIINYPEVAILGVGRAKERVLVDDGKFFAGHILPLSMSLDHRVVDGAEGARFLQTVIKLLEEPDSLLKPAL
jgi:pyruvate dehydrogenase E2 component (dihydrolipoamide acetyltransferase)